ncbi:MAG: glutathione S-transferase family protein [Pseudomonadota bacterium]
MGMLVDGEWQTRPQPTTGDGDFDRKPSQFRNWVTSDGSAGPSGDGGFKAEAGRYHLYVSLACPWANRTLNMRNLKGLQDAIGVSVVHWFMGDEGWNFADGDGVVADPIHNAKFMHEVYTAADPHATTKVTVPVLWDRERKTVVSNESSEIIRMLNSAFDGIGSRGPDYYPEDKRDEIDAINKPVYEAINNGVYRCGFASTQSAYDKAADALFETMADVEDRLARSRYLVGDHITEADVRLFPTLIRFDPVYHIHFKCSRKRLIEYPNLWGYTRELFQIPEFRETINFHHIRHHYFESHESVNPTRIVAQMPEMDLLAPHGRG